MEKLIREMRESDRGEILSMMRVFYASPAVSTNGSEEIFTADFDSCISDSPYLEGYIVECGGEIAGYTMLAKSFSTEFGKPCIWVEDLYIKEKYRGLGLGSELLGFIVQKYATALLRLEVEEDNERALSVYRRAGFDTLPYLEMKREPVARDN